MTNLLMKTAYFGRIPAGLHATVALLLTKKPLRADQNGVLEIPPSIIEDLIPVTTTGDQAQDIGFDPYWLSDKDMTQSVLDDIAESTPFKRILCTHYGHIDLFWPASIRSTHRVLFARSTPIVEGRDGESNYHIVRGENESAPPSLSKGISWGLEKLGCWITDIFDQNQKLVPATLDKHHMGGNYFVVEPKKLRKFDS